MDLPDCPPGTEGYEDSVVQVPHKKPDPEDCTKAEQEFLEHLNSLKIKVEDGSLKCMVERKGRDISGKWIYLCFPCAAVCSGESVLQTHISGKKHKAKLALKTVWPMDIFENHPYVQGEKGNRTAAAPSNKTLQKLAAEADLHNTPHSELDEKFARFRRGRCHILSILEGVKTPIIGLEYLIEHPPEEDHHEPAYICVLCLKQGHPRTIVNHLTCFWHRYAYIGHHYQKACALLAPFTRQQNKREGVGLVLNRLAQRIEDSFGRMKPLLIDKHEYEREKEAIHKWVSRGFHPSDKTGPSFENVVDVDLIDSLSLSKQTGEKRDKDPSPPVVAAPSKPIFNPFHRPTGRNERRPTSAGSLSDISDEERDNRKRPAKGHKARSPDRRRARMEPPSRQPSHPASFKSRYAIKHVPEKKDLDENPKAGNYDHKVKLALEKRQQSEEAMNKTLAYHEKNPEKHPLYPEEWKKFWNKRYKELQAEGKDTQKHDYKSEWIVFWTARMKELHIKELQSVVDEIYRKFNLTPPDVSVPKQPERKKTPPRHRSPERRRRSPEPRRRSPAPKHRSPVPKHRSPVPRHRSPVPRSRSPVPRSRSPIPRRSQPEPRREPPRPSTVDTSRKDFRRSPERRGPVIRWPSPTRPSSRHRNLSRSPVHGGSQSPLSRRESALRNRSPAAAAVEPHTVLISDDELHADNITSPWNSDAESLGSLPDADSRSHISYAESTNSRSRPRPHDYHRTTVQDLGPKDDVVSTIRLLVALEDYLGSLGPKIVDLLTDALKMEKEKANSSEELMLNETAMAVLETSKEKLKGAVQAGLVPHAATAAVRAAIVRVASLIHAAEKKAASIQKDKPKAKGVCSAVPVAGVGAVDRSQIAAQMAAALVAQGKTDVSPQELAHLVDAVVGMAEAKKREAEAVSKKEVPQAKQAAASTSALQMLQSAYDENEPKKIIDKEEPPDAMDGLSDSDLETLLKNFNELSAEEQHSLIAYLKKLEAKEPRRVERLREYVSAAAAPAVAPAPAPAAAPAPSPPPLSTPAAPPHQPPPVSRPLLTIDSDDDDYTVEEVFKSANKKVTENQIRQEMEIVKKSLEETKRESPPVPAPAPTSNPISQFSAANLLALVQASISSVTSPPSTGDLLTSISQPRSFGDSLPPQAPLKPQALVQPPVTPLEEFDNEPFENQHFDNQTPNLDENLDNPNPNFNQDFDNQNPDFNQDFDSQNPDFNQDFDNQNPDFNQDFDNQNPNFNQNFDNQNTIFNKNVDTENPNFNQNFENQNSNFDQNFGNQNPNFNQNFDNQNSNFNEKFDDQNSNFNLNFDSQNPSYNKNLDNQNPNFNKNFDNQNSNFNKNFDDQNSNMNQNFDMGYNYNNQGPSVGQDYSGPDPNKSQNFGMQNSNMGQNYGMGDQNMGQDYNNPNMDQDFYNQNQNNFNRNQNMNNFNQNPNKQNFNQNNNRGRNNNRNQQRGGRGSQNFKSNQNKPNDNFNQGQQWDNKPQQNAANSTLLRPPYMSSGTQPRFNQRGGGGGNFNPRPSGNFQRGGNQSFQRGGNQSFQRGGNQSFQRGGNQSFQRGGNQSRGNRGRGRGGRH